VRGLFDTVPPPAGTAGDNWFDARASTAIGRTLLDGLLFPGSDAELRLSWGKALGTCRQLVGILQQAAAQSPTPATPEFAPAPSPNPLPPPPPPPPGSEPAAPAPPALAPDAAMEFELCPRIEAAIAEIPRMLAAETIEEIEAVRDRFADVPERIVAVAGSEQFGPVAALEFQKGLELVHQATLTPPEQLANIAETLDLAAGIAANLQPAGSDEPAFKPAPSPNPLPPPPPPPL
jgi:hypothetical protein